MKTRNMIKPSLRRRGTLPLFFLLLGVTLSQQVGSQPVVTKACNRMRIDDCLVKQQVEYKDPGRSGENVLWDFSNQQSVNDHYELRYYGLDDSRVIGQEHKSLYRYHLAGDSLLLEGVENRTTGIYHRKPELQLVYPAAYGNKHGDYFHGNGDYGNHLFITSRGKTSVEADAYGVLLLPGGDTLRHVLRVHHVKDVAERMVPYALIQQGDTVFSTDSIDRHLATDTLLFQVDTYRWYADGYRYPVFETVSNRVILHRQPREYSHSSFYYKTVDQYYDLNNDPENQVKRDEEQERLRAMHEKEQSGASGGGGSGDGIISYNTGLTDGGNTLQLEYYLGADAEVSLMLFDIQGRQLSALHKGRQTEGIYRETISLYGYQPGEYTLRIVVNGQVFGIKIIK